MLVAAVDDDCILALTHLVTSLTAKRRRELLTRSIIQVLGPGADRPEGFGVTQHRAGASESNCQQKRSSGSSGCRGSTASRSRAEKRPRVTQKAAEGDSKIKSNSSHATRPGGVAMLFPGRVRCSNKLQVTASPHGHAEQVGFHQTTRRAL